MNPVRLALMAVLAIPSAGNAQSAAHPPDPPHAAAPAQFRELRVRIYSIHSPAELRISPRSAATRVGVFSQGETNPAEQSIQGAIEGALEGGLEIRASGSHLALTPGGMATMVRVTGAYRIETPGNAPLELQFPLSVHAENGRLLVDLRMPLEEYVAGVVAGEGVGIDSPESLKAMAVAVRTFARHFVGRHQAAGFDLCDTTHCQDLHLGAISARMRAAAEATRGEILWYEGRPAATYHHRHCGGSTEDARVVWPDAAAPYLRAQKDPYCVARDAARWRTEITKRDIAHALAASHVGVPDELDALSIVERSSSGRAVRLRMAGQEAVEVRAADLRFAVGRALGWDKIPSDLYDVRDAGEAVVFEGRGAGHGVGMCQTGAAALGARGKSYREILAFYFPGTILSSVAPGATVKP